MEAKHLALERGRKKLRKKLNPALPWDMIKMKVREKSIAYAAAKTTKLSPARISFTKKYQVWRKNWMKTLP